MINFLQVLSWCSKEHTFSGKGHDSGIESASFNSTTQISSLLKGINLVLNLVLSVI